MDEEQREKYMMQIPQIEAAYVPLTATAGQACANCRWLCVGEETHCHLVEGFPENILPTGWCNRWEAKPEMEAGPEPAPVPVVIVEESKIEDDMEGEKSLPEKLTNPLVKAIKSLFNRQQSLSEFAVFKGTDGKRYWVAMYTNNFQDLTKEIVTEKALRNDVLRKDAGFVPMPVLQSWHTPGSEHGEADMVDYVGHIQVAVGHFYDTPEGERAANFYAKNKVALSHGFLVPKWAIKKGTDGVTLYEEANTFEISTLPPGAAANPFTTFEEIEQMPFTKAKRAWLVNTIGEEKTAQLEQETESRSKAIEELGVRYKDFVDLSDQVEKSADEVTMGEAFVELLKAQGDLLTIQQAFAKRQDTFDEAVQSQVQKSNELLAQVKELLEQVKAERAAAPRIASEAAETALPDDMTDKLKEQLPEGEEYDSFFGDMKVKKGRA